MKGKSMKYLVIGFCFMLGCQQSPKTTSVLPSIKLPSKGIRLPSVFSDTALYRARCKEADTMPVITLVLTKCTPRDQRVEVR
jgi:hypothetical protein